MVFADQLKAGTVQAQIILDKELAHEKKITIYLVLEKSKAPSRE
jgi:hypothetical protein